MNAEELIAQSVIESLAEGDNTFSVVVGMPDGKSEVFIKGYVKVSSFRDKFQKETITRFVFKETKVVVLEDDAEIKEVDFDEIQDLLEDRMSEITMLTNTIL